MCTIGKVVIERNTESQMEAPLRIEVQAVHGLLATYVHDHRLPKRCNRCYGFHNAESIKSRFLLHPVVTKKGDASVFNSQSTASFGLWSTGSMHASENLPIISLGFE